MTEISFLASSRRLANPPEISCKLEEKTKFSVSRLASCWTAELEGLFTLPYLYEAHGLKDESFFCYLEKHMQTGDVFEVFSVPNQHDFQGYRRAMEESPEPAEYNAASLVYKDQYGTYQFKKKDWQTELSRKRYASEFGITTFVKY